MPCSNPIGTFTNEAGDVIDAACHRWGCEDCGKVMKNQVLDRCGRGFQQIQLKGGRVRAVCLTLGPKAENAKMGEYFARFRAWLAKPRVKNKKKKNGKRTTRAKRCYRHLNYFWTKEFQPDTGQLHLHILIDAYVHFSEIRKAWKWATYGTSTIIFATKINNEIYNPAGYMTKYMAKELEQSGQFRRKERRYGFSRGWKSPFMLTSYRAWLKLLPGQHENWTFELLPRVTDDPPDRAHLVHQAREQWRMLQLIHWVSPFNLKEVTAPFLVDP